MDFSYPLINENPEHPSASSDFYLEEIRKTLPRIRVRADKDDDIDEDEYWTGSNMNGHKTPCHDDDQSEVMETIILRMIESVLDEGDSVLDKRGSTHVSQARLSYQPAEQTFEANYSCLTRRNCFCCDNIVNQKIADPAYLDPEGSVSLQKKLLQNDQQIKDNIFKDFLESMIEVMTDFNECHKFGWLIERCDQSQLQLIAEKITLQPRTFIKALFFKAGANSVERLIEVLKKSSLVSDVVPILASEFVPIMNNRIASSVILKCFECLNACQNQKLYEELVNNCLTLATDEKGYLALMDSIILIRGPHRDRLIDLISSHAVFLSFDPSGNYVVQHVLDLENPYFTDRLLLTLMSNYVRLSTQKFASHVVERCLRSRFGLDCVIWEFINYDKLWEVARDQYGNYVLQKTLNEAQMAQSALYDDLVFRLGQEKEKFNKGYGRTVYNMIKGQPICKRRRMKS